MTGSRVGADGKAELTGYYRVETASGVGPFSLVRGQHEYGLELAPR